MAIDGTDVKQCFVFCEKASAFVKREATTDEKKKQAGKQQAMQ